MYTQPSVKLNPNVLVQEDSTYRMSYGTENCCETFFSRSKNTTEITEDFQKKKKETIQIILQPDWFEPPDWDSDANVEAGPRALEIIGPQTNLSFCPHYQKPIVAYNRRRENDIYIFTLTDSRLETER